MFDHVQLFPFSFLARHARRAVSFWCFLLLLYGTTPAQENPAPQRLEKLTASRFQSTQCPGLSVTVASNNEQIFLESLGTADLEQSVPMSNDSVQRLASLSKPITGTIIMDLVEQHKLELDSSVRQYLPELPSAYQRVTLRFLLDHQSGVQGYVDPAQVAFSNMHYAATRDAIKLFMASPLKFEPGTKTEYSSFGFALLGAAAESATGNSFQGLSAEFFRKHSLSGFYIDDPLSLVPKRVRGYLVDPNSKIVFNTGQVMTREYMAGDAAGVTNARAYDISNRYPAGGFDASAQDLLTFVLALATGKVLKPETVNSMWTAQTTADGTQTAFGLGWGVSEWRGHLMVGMNGAEPSTTAFLRYLPDSGTGIVLVCNAEGAHDLPKLLDDILATTLEGK